MALVLLPVLPVTAAGVRAASGKRRNEPAARGLAHAPLAVPLAPSLAVTKVDSFPDPDGDGKAEPGDTITYTVTVTNNGTDATNVQFSDTVDPNTTLVPGSVATQPVASNDSYNVLGNVRIQPNAAAGLLANDCDPDNGGPCSSAGLTASGPTSSAQGGNVTVNADGSFSYNPPAGYEGPDSFNYTVTDPTGKTDTATASFTVNDVVWFIDNTAPPGGDGRLTAPFNSLASVNGGGDPDEPFDVIYVLQGAGSYGGGIVLEDNQRLAGQGTSLDAALAVYGITVPPHSDARPAATGAPTLVNAGGDVVKLANNNHVSYLNASASAAGSAAVSGGAVGGSTVVNNVGASAGGTANGVSLVGYGGALSVTNGSVSANSSGTAVLVNGGSTGITFTNTAVSQNGGRVVNIQNRTGGLVLFNGSSTITETNGTTDAVFLNNGSGTVTFASPLQLNTNASGARGLVATGGPTFTLNVTGGGHAVSSTGGAAVDLQNITANVAFATTFSTNSNSNGVLVNNLSGAAAFGNTTVNNSAGTGVLLTGNGAALTFSDLDIAPASGQRALHATNNTGTLTSTSGTVATTSAVAVEVTSAATSPLNVQLTSVSASGGAGGIVLTNTTSSGSPGGFNVNGDGTSARNGSGGTVTATTDDGVRLTNASGVTLRSMNLTNDGDTVSPSLAINESTAGEHAVEISGGQNVVLSGVLVQNPAGSGLVALNLAGTNRINSDSLFTGVNNDQTHGVYVSNTGVNMALFEINNSDFTNSSTTASTAFFANAGTANMTVEVKNGCVFEALNNQALTISAGNNGITTGTLTSVVNGNTFRNAVPTGVTSSENNVAALVSNGATHNATIEANTFDNIAKNGLVANSSVIRTQNIGGKMTAVVKNNVLQNINYVAGAGGRHMIGHVFEPPVFNASDFSDLKIEGNTATNITYPAGGNREFIFIDYRPTASGGDIKIIGNNWNMPSSGTQQAMELRFRQTAASVVDMLIDNNGNGTGAVSNTTGIYIDIDSEAAASVNATVTNNNFNNSGSTPSRSLDFETEAATSSMCVNASSNTLPAAGASTIRLARTTGTMTVTQASAAAVSAANGGATVSVTGAPIFGSAPCSLPTNAFLRLPADAGRGAAVGNVEVASAGTAQSGSSADSKLFAQLDKTPRGFSNSERGQVLGAGSEFRAERPDAETPKAAPAAAPIAAFSGETVNVPIGTLRAGDSVTITFQVTVADPFTGAQPQVSNQATVTADGGVSVLSDDPSEPGAFDPTVTPILLPPSINVHDATVAEPASGSTNALFTVTLSHPFTNTVTVNFQTASGGANPATAGTDYTTTSGTVTFNAGETVQTVSVPVLADGTPAEGDETFLVNLSGATNGVIGDGQAIGTITDATVASAVIISELRTSGPNGSGDDFVELLNTTDANITVASSDGSTGWSIVKSGAGCSTTPVVVAVIPNGTVIPARGNYLLTGSAYSLGAYGAGDTALTADIEDDRNVGLFTTAEISNISSAARLDAVGFGSNTGDNCDLLREGTNLPAAAGSTSEYSFVRKVTKGLTEDTGDNAADFVVVSTTPAIPVGGNTPTLGAPGPEGSGSPSGPVPCSATSGSALFGRDLIDPAVGVANAPNVVRDNTAGPNSTFGTLDFRRTFTNNTGASVTALRFRVINLSTFPPSAGGADLRARSSSNIVVSTTSGPKTVQGTTLQTPPAQGLGGGVNSSLAAGTITLATPLPSGASVNLRFLFGVEQTGDYNIAFVLEAAPGPSGKDFWKLSGNTETGGHTDGGCNRAPVADAGTDQTSECSSGQGSVTLDGSGSSDPDGDTPLTYEWKEGATLLGTGQMLSVTLPNGSHTITLTVTDPSGDSSQDTVVVNVVDTTAPIVTDPPDVTVYTGPGASSCGMVVSNAELGTASASDGCEGSLAVNRTGVPAGNNFPVGTTVITYTATDGAGNTGSATQNVTVIDNTLPTVTPPANITANADANSCSAMVNPGTATGSDNCAVQSINGTRSDSQPLNAPYPVGTTTITWKVTDVNGNMATATQTVTVNDTTPPTITLNGAASMTVECHTSFTDPGASASDNCGTVTVTVGGSVNVNAPGTYTLTYNATDASGNAAAQKTRTVTVVDTIKPIITLNGANPMTVECHTSFTDPGATASDSCDTSVPVSVSGSVNVNVPGVYTLTYTAADDSGNAAVPVTRTVNVVDTTAPTITLNSYAPSMWPANHKYQTFNVTSFVASVSDGCNTSLGVGNVVIEKVTSDEVENGNGDGNTLNDIDIAGDCKSVQLRAEREGGGNGRVYTITFKVSDGSKVTRATARVVVPHNPGETPVDSGVHYTVNGSCP